MKIKRPGGLPITQQDLAIYLGVSTTLLSMTNTKRHGERQLTAEPSKKMAELVIAHQQFKKQGVSALLQNLPSRSANDRGKLAKKISLEAKLVAARIKILDYQLSDMVKKGKEDIYWLNTVTHLLAKLPKEKEGAGDRIWLENQQRLVAERLKKNDGLAQAKLEMQIETDKVRARMYKKMVNWLAMPRSSA